MSKKAVLDVISAEFSLLTQNESMMYTVCTFLDFPKGQKHIKLTAGGVLVTENAAFRKSQINISGSRYQMDFVKNDSIHTK